MLNLTVLCLLLPALALLALTVIEKAVAGLR